MHLARTPILLAQTNPWLRAVGLIVKYLTLVITRPDTTVSRVTFILRVEVAEKTPSQDTKHTVGTVSTWK